MIGDKMPESDNKEKPNADTSTVIDLTGSHTGNFLLGSQIIRAKISAESREWVARCVERIDFEDYSTIRRSLTFDLRIDRLLEAPVSKDSIYLPLMRLSALHHNHTMIEVTNELGSPLPRLTRTDERSLVGAGLRAHAASILFDSAVSITSIDETVSDALTEIADHELPPESMQNLGTQGARLALDTAFMDSLREAFETFYLVVIISRKPHRRVLHVHYKEQVKHNPEKPSVIQGNTGRQDAERLILAGANIEKGFVPFCKYYANQFIGAKGLQYAIDAAPRLAECESYHLEIYAPYDVRIIGTTLVLTGKKAQSFYCDDDRSSSTAHIHVSQRHAFYEATVFTRLIPVTTGTVRTTWLSACFIELIMLFAVVCIWFFPTWLTSLEPSSATAILLFSPAVLATALAKGSSHSLTTKLLFKTRFSVLASCLGLLFVAVSVSFNLQKSSQDDVALALKLIWASGWIITTAAWFSVSLTRHQIIKDLKRDESLSRHDPISRRTMEAPGNNI